MSCATEWSKKGGKGELHIFLKLYWNYYFSVLLSLKISILKLQILTSLVFSMHLNFYKMSELLKKIGHSSYLFQM